MTWVLALLKGFAPSTWLMAALAGVTILLGGQTLRLAHAQTALAQQDVQIASMQRDAANKTTQALEERRLAEHAKALGAERIANVTDQRLADASTRAVRAEHAAGELRSTIARLDSRAAPADAGAAAFAGEARVSRELLGACADEYTRMAGEADGLRAQVMGLQDFVADVAGAGK